MKMVRRTFNLAPAILCVLLVSFHTAYSQSLPPRSYLFVEVQDARGKPVADCSVSISNADGKRVVDVWTNKVLNLVTNKVGTVETGFLRTWVGIAKVLIAAGADVNLKDSHGQTALVIAKQYGHEAMAKLLAESTKP
jgi:hypothetical protein